MKKIIRLAIMTAMTVSIFACLMCISASADTISGAGFYSVGTSSKLTITPKTASDTTVSSTLADIDGDSIYEKFYNGSEKLKVKYTGSDIEAGDNILVLLVEGTGMPTTSNAIYYIDQTVKEGTPEFIVYPNLPSVNKDMTLWITSDKEGYAPVSVKVSYTPSVQCSALPVKLGDVNRDNKHAVNSIDALWVLQYSAGMREFDSTQKEVGDVNRDNKHAVNSVDALWILQSSAGLRTL